MASRDMTISIRLDGLSYDASSQRVMLRLAIQDKPCAVDWPEGKAWLMERASEMGITLSRLVNIVNIELLVGMKGSG